MSSNNSKASMNSSVASSMQPRFPARLNAAKGPHGEIVVTRTYTNFRYTVTMRGDGAIVVKPGDWLSKYSAAIYNDFTHVRDFGRIDRSGRLTPIHNVNLILAGETIYHIPTYQQAHVATKKTLPATPVSPLSEEQEKRMTVEFLEGEFHLRGEHAEVLEHIADLGEAAHALAPIAEMLHLLSEVAESGFGMAGAISNLVGNLIKWWNALEAGERMVGLRAIAYGITSWGFGSKCPGPPSWIRDNIYNGSHEVIKTDDPYAVGSVQRGMEYRKQQVLGQQNAWKEACQAAWNHMDNLAVEQIVHGHPIGPNHSITARKEWLQAIVRALGQGDPNKVVKKLMDAIARKSFKLSSEREAFWSQQPNYPN